MCLRKKEMIRHLIWFCIFIYFLFINCWREIPILGKLLTHLDEVLTCLAYIYFFVNFKVIKKKDKKLLEIWGGFWLIGLLSSAIFRYQTLFATCVDGILIVNKFIIGYITVSIYCVKNEGVIDDIFICIIKWTKWSILFLFMLLLNELFFDPFFLVGESRFGLPAQELVFGHPTYLVFAGVILLIVLTLDDGKDKYIYMIFVSGLIFFSLRIKAIGFLVIFWFSYFCLFVLKRRKLVFWMVGVCCILLAVLAKDQIIYYFFGGAAFSPRAILLQDSIKLGVSAFPFGCGFGTFGSNIAAQYYSPLYKELGYIFLEGMGANGNISFLSDSFWPCIIGQFGFLGCLVFVAYLWLLIKKGICVFSKNKQIGYAMLVCILYLLISSTSETSFFNPAAVLYAFLLGYLNVKADLQV